MHKKLVLANLAAVANRLDERGIHDGADALTQVMQRISQNAWWQNDAGEPMYSPEAIRSEERADSEREYDQDPGDYNSRHDFEEEEPALKSPSPHLLQAIQQIMGTPPGTPYVKGYVWGPLTDEVAFENREDLMKVVDWLYQHQEFNNEWDGYREQPPKITMPEDTADSEHQMQPEREDFGHFGDERLMGE
jgi:hypothetical protein